NAGDAKPTSSAHIRVRMSSCRTCIDSPCTWRRWSSPSCACAEALNDHDTEQRACLRKLVTARRTACVTDARVDVMATDVEHVRRPRVLPTRGGMWRTRDQVRCGSHKNMSANRPWIRSVGTDIQ